MSPFGTLGKNGLMIQIEQSFGYVCASVYCVRTLTFELNGV